MAGNSGKLVDDVSQPPPALSGDSTFSSRLAGHWPPAAEQGKIPWSRVLSTCCVLLGCAVPGALAQNCSTQRVSLGVNGQEFGTYASYSSISPYGRFVTFVTPESLLPIDTNGTWADTYLVDAYSGAMELVSVTPQGVSGNLDSVGPTDISDDGSLVAFVSNATDILPGLSNFSHLFVRDRALGVTSLVSVSSTGVEGDGVGTPHMTGDGRYVAFVSSWGPFYPGDLNNSLDIFVRDLQTNTTDLISISTSGTTGNNHSGSIDGPCISRDGRFIAFESLATDLAAGYTPISKDIYLRDRLLGVTSVVTRSSTGQPGNGISAAPFCSDDGNIIAFTSAATNLVPGDTNAVTDAFTYNVSTGITKRVSVNSLAIEGNARSVAGCVSADGGFIGFQSMASNLVPGDTNGTLDVFLLDRRNNQLERISVNANGIESNGASFGIAVSRDAAELAYQSIGSNLVPGDTNGVWDVFHRRCSLPVGYCTAKINSAGCQPTTSTSGIPMASGTQPFLVNAKDVLNQKPGLLIYSTAGSNAVPFAGGTLCLLAPVRRTPGQNSGGSIAGVDCTGTFSFDFNAWIASGSNPNLLAGATVWAQYWSRDPGFPPPNNAGLTDAQTFLIWP